MKWLVGLLLVAVVLEGIALIDLMRRRDQDAQTIGSSSQPAAAAPASRASSPEEQELAQKLAVLSASVEELRSRFESLHARQSRDAETSPVVTWQDLEQERFSRRVHELSLEAVAQRDERDQALTFEVKAKGFARSLSDRWPLRSGTVEDLKGILLRAYERERAIFQRYTPDGIRLTDSDPEYGTWLDEIEAYDAWIVVELQGLYGAPLDSGLESMARTQIAGYASPFKY